MADPDGIIAIVSQGPTAGQYPGNEDGRYKSTIGVNGVPSMHRCDWWVFSDWVTFAKWFRQVIGRPRVCTKPVSPTKFEAKVGKEPGKYDEAHEAWLGEYTADMLFHDQMGVDKSRFTSRGRNWNQFSGPAALGLAWFLRPAVVECYGCDMAGKLDIHGKGGNRGEGRWARERFIWSELVRLMAMDGIEVRHAVEDGPMLEAASAVYSANGPTGRPQMKSADDTPRDPDIPRRFTYMLGGEWCTRVFECADEVAFRAILTGMIGRRRAVNCEIKELPPNG